MSSRREPTQDRPRALPAACAALGSALLLVAFLPPLVQEVRLGATALATLALAGAAAALRGRIRGPGARDPIVAGASALVVLSPVWMLGSVVTALRSELGALHPATLIAAVLIWGLPAFAAWRLDRLPSEALKARASNIALAALSRALAFAGLEVAVRVLGVDPAGRPVWRRHVGDSPYSLPDPPRPVLTLRSGATWAHQYSSNDRDYFDPDNMIRYHLNAAGFRDREFGPRRSGPGMRIAFLGDSFGFGEGVRDEDVAAARMEELLPPLTGCPLEVYNFSVPSYATMDEAILLEQTAAWQADAAIVWYFLNDVEANATMRYLGADAAPVFFPVARRFSAVARFAGARLDARFRAGRLVEEYRRGYASSSAGWRSVVEGFRRMAEFGRQHGMPVIVFVHPILYRLDGDYPFADIHAQAVAEAREKGLIVFDLLEVFRGKQGESLWVHPSDQHPNEKAHAIAAAYAADKLRTVLTHCPERPTGAAPPP